MVILVFTSADDAVAGAVRDYVYVSEGADCELDDGGDGFARADVAEGASTVGVPVLHLGEGVFEDAATGEDEVVLGKAVSG